jgi:hypothetical protein
LLKRFGLLQHWRFEDVVGLAPGRVLQTCHNVIARSKTNLTLRRPKNGLEDQKNCFHSIFLVKNNFGSQLLPTGI